MIRQLFLLSSIASIDAFLTPPSLHVTNSVASSWQSQSVRYPSSPLHAEASSDGDATADDAAEATPAPAAEDETDILNSPAFLQRKVEVLQSDITALEKEIEEANALLVAGKEEWGSKFDMVNRESQYMKERYVKAGAKGTEMATVDVATKIINVLDIYDGAFNAVEAATNEEVEIVDAYQKTYDMILDAFVVLNVTKVETVGEEFDHNYHQAMMQMPSDEYEEGLVSQEFAKGWKCGEKLIRPAMVVVAA
mmetsp:Transcript_20282/g.33063  ORF Transcript_20282/g.33063 Transcript_20282/m.33063 type:complete len:251 (-) Transcript_20282:195-947(-)